MSDWLHRDGSPFEGEHRLTVGARGESASYQLPGVCSRCGGRGGSEAWRFTGWTCYQCGGSGQGRPVTVRVYTPEKLEKLNAAQAKRDAKRAVAERREQAKRDAAIAKVRDVFLSQNPTLLGLLDAIEGVAERYVQSLRGQLNSEGQLSELQTQKVHEIAAQLQNPSEHVGAIGERVTVQAKLERIVPLGISTFGYRKEERYLLKFRTPENDELAWFTSWGNAFRALNIRRNQGDYDDLSWDDKLVTLKATVKKHDVYQGKKSTVVQRVTVDAPVDDPVEQCPDCGERGERKGHQTCQYPQD